MGEKQRDDLPLAPCRSCDGTGYNSATKRLYDDWYSDARRWCNDITQHEADALWEKGRLWDFSERPTAEAVNLWSLIGIGHDAVNRHICVVARAKRYGFFGLCEACGGSGEPIN